MFQISNWYQIKMGVVLAKDNAQEEPKIGEGTMVNPKDPVPVETSVGGLKKRLREDDNNSEVMS